MLRHRISKLIGAHIIGGDNSLNTLLNTFQGAGDEAAIRYDVVGANNTFYLSQHLGNRKYWTLEIYSPEALIAGNEWASIRRKRVDTLYGGYNTASTPAVSLNGAGWNDSTGTFPGGRLMYNATATRYAQVVTPDGVTAVGAIGNATATNVGLALITIDGDNTLATLLPTAQDVVDSGAYANTILVANGGTLNPTDRVWDQYNQAVNYAGPPAFNAYHYELFATNLSAAAHTVRITVTGYKRAAASAASVLFYVMMASGAGASLNIASSTYEACLIPEIDIYDITSTFPREEISYNTKPTGATNYEWVGHTASLKILSAPAIVVDGTPQTMSDNQTLTGTTITITQQLRVRHTEIGGGATEVGVLDLVYSMNASTGLTVTHTLNWSMGGVAVGYPCMLTVEHSVFDRFQTLGSGIVASDLSANDDSVNFSTPQQAAYSWDSDGYGAAMYYIPNLANTVESWSKSTNKLFWSDISTSSGAWKKAYAQRFATDETFTSDTVWTSESNYRAMWFSDGADNHLS